MMMVKKTGPTRIARVMDVWYEHLSCPGCEGRVFALVGVSLGPLLGGLHESSVIVDEHFVLHAGTNTES